MVIQESRSGITVVKIVKDDLGNGIVRLRIRLVASLQYKHTNREAQK